MKFRFSKIPLLALALAAAPISAADLEWCAIGNSFSFRNAMYQSVEHFIANDGSGETTRFQRNFAAGAAAQEHWLYDLDMLDIRRIARNSPAFDELGEYTSMLENGPWDYFVIQHYPGTSDDPSPLRLRPEATRRWVERVAEIDPSIEPIIYATAVGVGSDLADYLADQKALNALNERMAREHGIGMVPCGHAWVRVIEDDSSYYTDRILHAEDDFHPDDAGSYLQACVFYAYFTGRSPVGLPWDFEIIFGNEFGSANFDVELDAALALYLQEKAWETHQQDAIFPE